MKFSRRLVPIWGTSILFSIFSCQRKLELLPAGAKNISRSDTNEEINTESGTSPVKLREYRFTVAGPKPGQNFVCESREFTAPEYAIKAARKSIAERPEEELKSERAHFALSGRSLWLRIDKSLLWCMYAGPQPQNTPSPVAVLKESFISKFREAT